MLTEEDYKIAENQLSESEETETNFIPNININPIKHTSSPVIPLLNPLNTILPTSYKEITPIIPKIDALHEETLFYIFYNFPNDALQIQAYEQLIKKKYIFCTLFGCFIMFNGKIVADGSRKQILIFDPYHWEKIVKEITFNEEFVESLKN